MASLTGPRRISRSPGTMVRYVGDHVAVVIAETAAQAKDAAQAVEVDFEILPANVDTGARTVGSAVARRSARQSVATTGRWATSPPWTRHSPRPTT